MIQNDAIRVGVVGIGKMGLLHGSLLSCLPNVQVIAFCDNNETIVKYIRKLRNGISVVMNVTDLCKLDLDAVYVTTPIPTHYGIINSILSMDRDLGLFTEKTLTDKFEDSDDLAKRVKGQGGPVTVGYHKRFAVTFRKAKSLLNAQALGSVESFDAYAYSEDFLMANNVRSGASRGGVLKDLGSHSIDMAIDFFGDLHVEALKKQTEKENASADTVSFEVSTKDGISGSFDMSWAAPGYHKPEVGLTITGEKGTLFVNDDKVSLKLKKDDKESLWSRHTLDDNVPFLLAEPEYFREDEQFIASLRNGQQLVLPDFESASKVDYIISEVQAKNALMEN